MPQVQIDLGDTVRAGLTPFVDLFLDRDAARAWLARYLQRAARDGQAWQDRLDGMLAANPLYVLRNHLAQQAIDAATQGDPSEIDRLVKLLANPFVAQDGMQAYAALPPAWASKLEVSCSS